MIIVTGSRRSGTSLWMQILKQGGFPVFGKPFPANWKMIEGENHQGYYESQLVEGINYKTNPDPRSGAWVPPQQVEGYAVKIFADGLVKTDYAYISKAILTIRNWQDCEASLQRFKSLMSEQNELVTIGASNQYYMQLPPGYAWWKSNFSVLQDMMVRRYPTTLCSYENLLADPEKVISQVFNWLGDGNASEAISAVDQSMQTQKNTTLTHVNHEYTGIFDELYHTLNNNIKISQAFYDQMLAVNKKITAELDEILPSND